jgi:hypothetical protein
VFGIHASGEEPSRRTVGNPFINNTNLQKADLKLNYPADNAAEFNINFTKQLFSGCTNLQELKLNFGNFYNEQSFDTVSLAFTYNFDNMLSGCSSLSSITLEGENIFATTKAFDNQIYPSPYNTSNMFDITSLPDNGILTCTRAMYDSLNDAMVWIIVPLEDKGWTVKIKG